MQQYEDELLDLTYAQADKSQYINLLVPIRDASSISFPTSLDHRFRVFPRPGFYHRVVRLRNEDGW
jgi:hypothetical protein